MRARTWRVAGWAGTRTPTVSRPPVTASGTRDDRCRSSVSGPGQHVSASTAAWTGTSATQRGRSSAAPTWTINGWVGGRPLTSKMRATAAGCSASAASPYTVSVGTTASPPAAMHVGDALDVLGDQRVSTHRSERTTASPRLVLGGLRSTFRSGRPPVRFPEAFGRPDRRIPARRSRSASATRPGRV